MKNFTRKNKDDALQKTNYEDIVLEVDGKGKAERKSKTVANRRSLYLARTAILLALVSALQFLGLQYLGFLGPLGKQVVVGAIVNFILFFSVKTVGVFSGSFIGIMTPVMALALGHATTAVTMPFIMLANCSLVVTYYLIQKTKKKWWIDAIAIVVAPMIKFSVMYLLVQYVIPLLPDIKPPMLAAMQLQWSWPQIVTGLIGGTLSLTLYQSLKGKVRF